jgi:hypothetical protein
MNEGKAIDFQKIHQCLKSRSYHPFTNNGTAGNDFPIRAMDDLE